MEEGGEIQDFFFSVALAFSFATYINMAIIHKTYIA
jgi:hypothetical protein